MKIKQGARPKTPAELLKDYLRTPKKLTAEFLHELAISRTNEVKAEFRVTEAERRIIHAKRLVERSVEEFYFPEMIKMPSAQVPEIAEFTQHWGKDEKTHDEVLTELLDATGAPLEDFRRPYDPVQMSWFGLLPKRAAIALPMAWGALNEGETYAGYIYMGRKTKNPTLRVLFLEGLAPEELAHRAFYSGMARYFLHKAPVSQVLVRLIMAGLWKGVGGDVLPPDIVKEMLRHMFIDEQKFFSKTVGDSFRRLPGMKGFNAPERSLRAVGIS